MDSVKLVDICRIEKGQQIDTSRLNDSHRYRYINGGVKESGYYDSFNSNEECVLVSEGGASCGYVNYINEPFWCGCHCYRLFDLKVMPKYLYYALKANQERIMDLRTGVCMPNIKKKDFQDFVVSIDSDAKRQDVVVKVLDTIQKAIDLKRKQLEDLDELVKSKFQEMFGDVDTNDKGFETVIGKDVFSFSSGKFLSAEKRKEEGIPVYGGNGISWFTDEALIDYPTIIIGRVGAYCGNVKMVNTPVWITDNAIFIKSFKKQVFNIRFLCQLMENASFDKYADVVAQPKITQKPLENYKYIVPDIKLQERFADYVKSVDMARKTVGDELVDLGELMDSKMDEYFG